MARVINTVTRTSRDKLVQLMEHRIVSVYIVPNGERRVGAWIVIVEARTAAVESVGVHCDQPQAASGHDHTVSTFFGALRFAIRYTANLPSHPAPSNCRHCASLTRPSLPFQRKALLDCGVSFRRWTSYPHSAFHFPVHARALSSLLVRHEIRIP